MPSLTEMMNLLVNGKPVTYKQIREMNRIRGRVKYPYEEVSNRLNSLTEAELGTIPKIIHDGELSVMRKVGIKKLFGMVKNKAVKEKMKELYNL